MQQDVWEMSTGFHHAPHLRAAPRAPPASINNQTEIVNGERGHYLVWSVRVKG